MSSVVDFTGKNGQKTVPLYVVYLYMMFNS